MEFKGKTAVVTGSSGGIGKGVAIALAKEGADVVLASRNLHNMEAIKKEIEGLGRRAVAIQCDVANDESVAAMKDKALAAFGNIDILINNAAVGVRGLLENVSLDDWRYIINTNLMGYIRNVTAFLPHFMKRGSGYIVNVSSIQALAYGSEPLNIPYITTKAGILGFTDCLSAYLRPNIKVSCLIPGAVATEISHNTRFVGTEEQKKKMWDDSEKFWKLPVLLAPMQCAEGLLEGMKKEEYLILVPADMGERVKSQGRDVAKLNAWVANPPPPRMPPPRL
jgi:3-oxoacyl-[acyl-carrier protein] reductase